MRIKSLTLYNFGVYAGDNTFEFNSNKPVCLIGGMNGRGKTTFLDAVLLALYGQNSFAFYESKYKSYSQYLRSFVNRNDRSLLSYVELQFQMDSAAKEVYTIKRKWSGAGARTKEKVSVKKNGRFNQFLTDNWPMFAENILPSGLSNFFFFDGEKIAELALDSTNAQMKQSIKKLLGISILDILEKDISRIIARCRNRSRDTFALQEIERLEKQTNQAALTVQEIDERIGELTRRLEKTKKSLERAKMDYTTQGGDIVIQQQDLFNKRNYLMAQIHQQQEQLVYLASGEMPLLMLKPLLEIIKRQSLREHESKVMDLAIKKIKSMFGQYLLQADENHGSEPILDQFISYIEGETENDKTTIQYDLSDRSLYQLRSLTEEYLDSAVLRAKKIIANREENQKAVDEIDNYLSVDIDEIQISRIYRRIKELEQEIIDITTAIDAENHRRQTANGALIRAVVEHRKYVEEMLSGLELIDDEERIIKYSYQVIEILKQYRIKLQEKKIGVLADTMTDCYRKLASKKNMIERIRINETTLDFLYFDYDGVIVPNDSLSAGEKQLMVISLLWALAICSKKNLPVIIDTPLSRLDSNHRVSLISTYFPKASNQTIILSTDSEIDQHYYEIMKDKIGDEFTLIYDDMKKCSSIIRGYFLGDNNDHKTD